MSANDNTEKVLRQLHVLLSKSEPYPSEPSKVIVDKQQVIDLLSELNKCIYAIQDEYELTAQSRERAEREFKKKGDQIIWDASRTAEDVYAASVLYTDEALGHVRDIIKQATTRMEEIQSDMRLKLKEQEQAVRANQSQLKSSLQDLRDTEKYIRLIEDRNKEIQKEKEAGLPKALQREEANLYANRQTEVKVNMAVLQQLGLATEELDEEPMPEEPTTQAQGADQDEDDVEAILRAELDADYFNWKEENDQ